MRRIAALLALVSLAAAPVGNGYPAVAPGRTFHFPADHGAHPAYRTEWWYVTGWLRTDSGRDMGFQVTFFRTRPYPGDDANPSRFAPHQLLFAHAALSDPEVGHILHGEIAARAGFGLAAAATGDADVRIRDWRILRHPDGHFATHVATGGFGLTLDADPQQSPLLEGEGGYSRKGPLPAQASYYYSLPHLRVSGIVNRGGKTERVTGEAWLDREWSSDYLAPDAVGWDWTGLNLDDGGALMAFRIRRKDGSQLWAGGSLRRADGQVVRLGPADVRFDPLRRWRSPHTGALYPVEQLLRVRLPEGERLFSLAPLFPDQELDGRSGGMPVYWEGAVRTSGGKGYLELTGYAAPLAM